MALYIGFLLPEEPYFGEIESDGSAGESEDEGEVPSASPYTMSVYTL